MDSCFTADELIARSFGILKRVISTEGVRFLIGVTLMVVVGDVLDADDWEDEDEQDAAKQAEFICRLVISLALILALGTSYI